MTGEDDESRVSSSSAARASPSPAASTGRDEERNPAQKAFLDGLQALAKPALASNNPLRLEEAAKQSLALADKVGAFTDWCGTLRKIEGTAQKVAITIEIGPQVSLYAFNDWTLGLRRLRRRPFLHTIARNAAAGAFRSGHRGAKNLAARRTRDACRAGWARSPAPACSISPACSARAMPTPPVPADAALRGAHRGAGGDEEEIERNFGCRPSTTISRTARKKLPVFAVQRRGVLAASRRDGGPAHDGQGRQRGRCRDRQRDRHHRGRADHERHRLRRLLHPVGRQQAGRPQRLGPFARADDARPVRGPGQDRRHRLGLRQHAGRGVAVDDAARALRQAALRRPVRAGDQVRPRRLPRLLHGGAPVGRARSTGCKGQDDWVQGVPAQRPRAAAGRALEIPRPGEDAAPRSPRARARPSIAASSPRRWTSTPRRPAARCAATTSPSHKADWVDPIGLTYRGTTLHEIPPNGQGIAACMALGILENFDVAGHDRRRPRDGASADRGDEARLRRPLSLRRRSALHGGDAGADARQGATSRAAPS